MKLLVHTANVVAFVAILFIQTSCTDYTTELKGDIIGIAYAFDEAGNSLYDHSNIKVHLLGGNDQTLSSTKTNADGRFELKNITMGTYRLKIEKEGYGTMYLDGVQHYGGKPTYLQKTGQVPFIYEIISGVSSGISLDNDGYLYFKLPFTEQTDALNSIIYFSTSADFAPESAMATLMTTMEFQSNNSSWVNLKYKNLPFEPGTNVYVKIQFYTSRPSSSYNAIDTYYDLTNNKVYPNISPISDEFSFIMP